MSMDATTLARGRAVTDDRRLAEAVATQAPRLRAFIRRQVDDLDDADDIVQEVLTELVAAARLTRPIEHLAAWLFRIARNRIIDRFRYRSRHAGLIVENGERGSEPERVLDEWLPNSPDDPEIAYARSVLVDELMTALDELPPDQQEVFLQHEIEGRDFAALAAETGVPRNTLLWRKHAAVRHLRRRLQAIHAEFTI